MKVTLILIFSIFYSCSQENLKTNTIENLLSIKGEPESIDQSSLNASKTFYNYPDSKYQVEESSNIVEARFRSPIGSESYINYWKEKLSGRYYDTSKADGDLNEFVLSSEEKNLRILFKASGKVIWIESRGEMW